MTQATLFNAGEVRPTASLHRGDCLDVLRRMDDASVHAIVTDPPYGLSKEPDVAEVLAHWLAGDDYEHGGGGFMGKTWDSFVPGPSVWRECLRVLKPGGHLLCFAGSRTVDLMGISIRLAGFEIRDQIQWIYGCLSEDTEILVNGEWERYQNIKEGDLALCYDNEHDTFSWRPIERVVSFGFSDTAFRLVGDRTDQIITPNHRCLVERNGSYVFETAQEASRQRQALVPVLEGLLDLLHDLPLLNEGTGTTEQDLLSGMLGGFDQPLQQREGATEHQRDAGVSNLPQEVQTASVQQDGKQTTILLTEMPREEGRRSTERDCIERPTGVDRGVQTFGQGEDVWTQQPGMEGRCDVLPQEREIQERQVRQMPTRVHGNVSQGRVRHGASTPGGYGGRSDTDPGRDRSSRGSRPNEQRHWESALVQDEQRPQEVRASRFTSSDLVRIEPEQYDGVMWCVTVPTGAFVARRKGKMFVTGNSGFPKAQSIGKTIDKAHGVDGKEWDGWATALKPAHEPIIVARKPLSVGGRRATVATNVLTHGTGAMNIDASRIGFASAADEAETKTKNRHGDFGSDTGSAYIYGDFSSVVPVNYSAPGRWPANVVLDPEAGEVLDGQSGTTSSRVGVPRSSVAPGDGWGMTATGAEYNDSGGASRFFYCAKASKSERNTDLPPGNRNTHPTVKPVKLMEYLVRLVTPAGGTVLDPYMGSGTTLVAAARLGFDSIGIDRDDDNEYLPIARMRLASIADITEGDAL